MNGLNSELYAMAIIDKGYLRGQIGDLVNRKVGTQNIVQTKPAGKVQQTDWSKAAASDFGSASRAGALIRRAFRLVHQHMHDEKMHNRLVKQLQRVMRATENPMLGSKTVERGDIRRLMGFQFNENCHMHDYVYFDPLVELTDENRTEVRFPAFHATGHLYAPRLCSHAIFRLEAVAFDFGQQKYSILGEIEIEIPRYAKTGGQMNERTVVFDPPTSVGYNIVLVGMNVLYVMESDNRSYVYNNKDLHPAAIIGAFRM